MTEEENRVSMSPANSRHESEVAQHAPHAAAQSQILEDGEDDRTDDTVELTLSPECALALSQAAEEEHADATLTAPLLDCPNTQTGNAKHQRVIWFGRGSLVLASSLAGVAIGVAMGLAIHFVPTVPTATTEVPRTARSTAAPSAESPEPPLELTNPFDRSEVFKFPPGTSADQARRSVAALLLQRARDRQGVGVVKSKRPTPGAAADRARVARNSEPRSSVP